MEIRELLRLYIDESTLEYGENSTASIILATFSPYFVIIIRT